MDGLAISTPLRSGTIPATPGHHHNQQQQQYQYPDVWSLEKSTGHLVGEDFSIDDLLNFSSIPDEALEQEEFGEEEKVAEDDNGSNSNSRSGLAFDAIHADQPLVPAEDVSDLEWVSQIVDDTFVVDIPCSAVPPSYFHPPTTTAAVKHGRSPSAGSVTSVSTSVKRTFTFSDNTVEVPSKVRSKRARTGGRLWSLHRLQLPEPMSCSLSSSSSCSSTSSPSSCLMMEPTKGVNLDVVVHRGRGRPPLHKKNQAAATGQQQVPPSKQHKKKGRKPKATRPARAEHHETTATTDGVSGRRCSHCGVQKTPQWRAGPLGAKTLCNACGVRYKSGRLLPEYRPAVSPTFLDHVHSNSHKKVLEMRRKKELMQQEQEEEEEEEEEVFVVGDSAGGGPPSPPLFLPTPLTAQHMVF